MVIILLKSHAFIRHHDSIINKIIYVQKEDHNIINMENSENLSIISILNIHFEYIYFIVMIDRNIGFEEHKCFGKNMGKGEVTLEA